MQIRGLCNTGVCDEVAFTVPRYGVGRDRQQNEGMPLVSASQLRTVGKTGSLGHESHHRTHKEGDIGMREDGKGRREVDIRCHLPNGGVSYTRPRANAGPCWQSSTVVWVALSKRHGGQFARAVAVFQMPQLMVHDDWLDQRGLVTLVPW